MITVVLLPGDDNASGPVTGGSAPSAFATSVLAVVAATRPGELMTYAEVAREAGSPGAARAVGQVLRHHGSVEPWWRVVRADGRLVPGVEDEHARRLSAEGVETAGGRVLRDRHRGVARAAGTDRRAGRVVARTGRTDQGAR